MGCVDQTSTREIGGVDFGRGIAEFKPGNFFSFPFAHQNPGRVLFFKLPCLGNFRHRENFLHPTGESETRGGEGTKNIDYHHTPTRLSSSLNKIVFVDYQLVTQRFDFSNTSTNRSVWPFMSESNTIIENIYSPCFEAAIIM